MKQLRFSGSGGQGVITAAIIFAEAAVNEGKEAVQSQPYGPEARGGASKAEVIINDTTIYHPHVEQPDLVLAMTQKAADKYYKDLNASGTLLVSVRACNTSALEHAGCARSISTRVAVWHGTYLDAPQGYNSAAHASTSIAAVLSPTSTIRTP